MGRLRDERKQQGEQRQVEHEKARVHESHQRSPPVTLALAAHVRIVVFKALIVRVEVRG